MAVTKAHILTVLATIANTIVAEDSMGATIEPQGAVRRVGDTVMFECSLPDGNLDYREIQFEWEHGEQRKVLEKKEKAGDYTKVKFAVVVSKQHAGTYKCHINTKGGARNVNVTVTTELYVVQAENKTAFVKKGSSYSWVCLESDNLGFKPAFGWYIEGKVLSTDSTDQPYYVNGNGSHLHIKNAGKKDAFTDIRCAVTSLEAFKTYGSVDAARENQSAAEIQKTISVIEISNCLGNPCQLEVKVYGQTPVDISWKIDSRVVNATHEKTENVTVSKTDVLNSTEPVLLNITGGQSTWLKRITPDFADDVSDSPGVREIIGIVAGAAGAVGAVAVFGLVFYCKRTNRLCFKKQQENQDEISKRKMESELANLSKDEDQDGNGKETESDALMKNGSQGQQDGGKEK